MARRAGSRQTEAEFEAALLTMGGGPEPRPVFNVFKFLLSVIDEIENELQVFVHSSSNTSVHDFTCKC